MTKNKDNLKKIESTAESSQKDESQASEKSAKKERFQFKKEDLYEITYNF